MNDSVVDEPQQLSSSVSVGAGDEKTKSIAAVSISQIIKFTRPNEGLVLYGKKVYHLNLVALIHEVLDINPQKIHLLLDDYTNGGPLEVSHIMGDVGTPDEDPSLSMFHGESAQGAPVEGQPKSLNLLRVGDYVRCIGVVKYSSDRPNFVAYNMRYVDDPNEITMHHLEVIRDAMHYHKLQMGGGSGAATTDSYQQPAYNQPQSTTTRDAYQPQDNFGKLSTRDKHLLQFLRSTQNKPEGMTLDEICGNFTAFGKKDIRDSLEALSAEGLVWQGDSEELWCAYVS